MAKVKQLNTWEKVCEHKGISPVIPITFNESLDAATKNFLTAAYKLPIIIEVRNGGWQPDYTDMSQYKYELWLKVHADNERPSGFGLSYGDFGSWASVSTVGVRFAFKDSDTAKKTFADFKDIFEHFFLRIG